MTPSHLLTPLLTLTASFAVNAQTWAEAGDAGPIPATAQVPGGVGPLLQIDGE